MPRSRHSVFYSGFIRLIVLCCLASFLYWMYATIYFPLEEKDQKVHIVITPGTSTHAIGLILEHEKLIKSPLIFVFYLRLTGAHRNLQAGYHELNTRMSMQEIVTALKKGNAHGEIAITIPEGYTLEQISGLLHEKSLITAGSFETVLNDSGLKNYMGIPHETAEGYLFPDTYFLSYNTTPERIVTLMHNRFHEVVDPLYSKSSSNVKMSLDDVVILASIIQREASNDQEMPTVASVFINRLRRKMPLQSEATVRYGLKKFSQNLSLDDLKVDSPYNTYQRQGLPAAPICNPGAAAIKAVLNPVKSQFLYFMADENGNHTFSYTYEQHNRAVAQYKMSTSLNSLNQTTTLNGASTHAQ